MMANRVILLAGLFGLVAPVRACHECMIVFPNVLPRVATPLPAMELACPCPIERTMSYACPQPAPASPGPTDLAPPATTHEPPTFKGPKGPTIFQNRTFSGVPQYSEPRSPSAKVSFWNLSGYDVTLSVGERTHAIPRDRAVVLDLNRSFTWRTNLHNPKTEQIPDDTNHFEVLIK